MPRRRYLGARIQKHAGILVAIQHEVAMLRIVEPWPRGLSTFLFRYAIREMS